VVLVALCYSLYFLTVLYCFLHLSTSLTKVLYFLTSLTSLYISLQLLTTLFFSQIYFLGILLLQFFFKKIFFVEKNFEKICSWILIFWKIFFRKIYLKKLLNFFEKNSYNIFQQNCEIKFHKLNFAEKFFENKILKKNSQNFYNLGKKISNFKKTIFWKKICEK